MVRRRSRKPKITGSNPVRASACLRALEGRFRLPTLFGGGAEPPSPDTKWPEPSELQGVRAKHRGTAAAPTMNEAPWKAGDRLPPVERQEPPLRRPATSGVSQEH